MSVARRSGGQHPGLYYRGRQLAQASHFALRAGGTYVRNNAHHVAKYVAKQGWNHINKRWTSEKKAVAGNRQASASHSGVSEGTVSVGNWKKPKYGKRMTPKGRFKYQQSYKGITGGTAGQQTVTDFTYPNTISKCLDNTALTYSTTQNQEALVSCNPSNANTGSAYFPSIQNPNNSKFVIISNTIELEMTSMSNVGTFVDIYICKAKKWASKIPGDVWGDAAASQSFSNPVSAQPVAGLAAGTLGYPIITEVGNRPGAFNLFNQFWAIKKVVPLTFTASSTEKLTIHIGINKVVDVAKLLEMRSSTNPIFIPGVSYGIFMIQRGAVDIDKTVGRVPTYGGTELAWVVQEKTLMRDVEQAASRFNTSVLYSNVPTGATAANQSIINEVDVVAAPVVV